MMSARSVSVIVRGHDLGRRVRRQRDDGQAVERADEPPRVERRRRRPAGRPRAAAARDASRLATEQADPHERAVGQRTARIAVGAVEQQPRAQLGLRVGAFVRERGRVARIGAVAAASPGS